MLTRRQMLARTLQGSSLFALGAVVPEFLLNTARATEPGRENVLVVLELTGGNDGLNTVIPYADDLYHRARPTLRLTRDQVVRVNDQLGLHPALRPIARMLEQGQLAIVQGVGYPNPDRSHFESMDVWHSADPNRRVGTGWLGRALPLLPDRSGGVPGVYLGRDRLPLALGGGEGNGVTLNDRQPFRLELGSDAARRQARRRLLDDQARAGLPAGEGLVRQVRDLARDLGVAVPEDATDNEDLLQFVRRRQVQTYTTMDRLREVLEGPQGPNPPPGQPAPPVAVDDPRFGPARFGTLNDKLNLVARLVQRGVGTRVFYLNLD